MNNSTLKSIAIWVAIALILMTIFNQFSGTSKNETALVYSQFMEQVKEGKIAKVEMIQVLRNVRIRMSSYLSSFIMRLHRLVIHQVNRSFGNPVLSP